MPLERLFFFTFIFLSSCCLTWLLRIIALQHSLLDIPNQRSSHTLPTPRGGGLAIVIVAYLGGAYLTLTGRIAIPYLFVFGACGLGIAIIGLVDDLFHLSSGIRIVVHLSCALLALNFLPLSSSSPISNGEGILSTAALILLAFVVAWSVNLYNFMDGIDGLAGIEAVTVSLGAGFLLYFSGETGGFLPLLLLLAASVLGFLMLNWPPARIFMGDGCSGFLGFFFAIMALLTAQSTVLTLWAWLILLGVFVVDSGITLLTRICLRKKIYEAHRSHAYQILARRLQSHKKVTFAVLAVNVLWLFPWAFCATSWPGYGLLITFLSYIPLILVCLMVKAGAIND